MSEFSSENPYAAKVVEGKGDGPPPRTSGKAIASFVLGLLSPIFCLLTAVPGAILGFMGLGDINRSQGRVKGSGLAITGIVFSLFSTVALAPLMIMVLLLLPAINAAREAARRNGCLNNMRQLALGAANHESATKRYPVASQGTTDLLRAQTAGGHGQAPSAGDDGLSWQYQLLPHLEEQILFQEMQQAKKDLGEEFTGPFDDRFQNQIGEPFAATQLGMFRCPSFSGEPITSIGGVDAAVGNYCAIVGTDTTETDLAEWKSTPNWENGGLPSGCWSKDNSQSTATMAGACEQRGIGLRQLGDGISKTIIAVESREEVYSAWISGACMWVVGASPNSLAAAGAQIGQTPDRFIAVLQGGQQQTSDGVGLALNFGNYRAAPAGDHYFSAGDWATAANRLWGPSSEHAGDIMIHVYADCHAQAIPSHVNPSVYLRFITRSDGDPANEVELE
jgi:hypothetical protein